MHIMYIYIHIQVKLYTLFVLSQHLETPVHEMNERSGDFCKIHKLDNYDSL